MTSSLHLKARLSDSALFLSVLTLGELRKGIKESVSDPDFSVLADRFAIITPAAFWAAHGGPDSD